MSVARNAFHAICVQSQPHEDNHDCIVEICKGKYPNTLSITANSATLLSQTRKGTLLPLQMTPYIDPVRNLTEFKAFSMLHELLQIFTHITNKSTHVPHNNLEIQAVYSGNKNVLTLVILFPSSHQDIHLLLVHQRLQAFTEAKFQFS